MCGPSHPSLSSLRFFLALKIREAPEAECVQVKSRSLRDLEPCSPGAHGATREEMGVGSALRNTLQPWGPRIKQDPKRKKEELDHAFRGREPVIQALESVIRVVRAAGAQRTHSERVIAGLPEKRKLSLTSWVGL